MRSRMRGLLDHFPAALARAGVVDRERGDEAFDLALPVMVSGAVRTVLRVADFFMVSLALSAAAVAGLEFAFQYYFIGFGLALALSSGTISVVSRLKGAGDDARADFAVKQSLWLAALLSAPLIVGAWFLDEAAIGLLTDDPATIRQGSIYLRIVMLGVLFRFWSMIASRALAGSGDTRTPMYVNLVTVPTNLVLNALLIFGFGPAPRLGIAGAAWGTVAASALSAVIFFYLLVAGGRDVGLRLGGRQWDTELAGELIRVSSPLAGKRLAGTLGRFPFLFVLGVLGTEVVAAYAISRRVIMLAMMPAWGYSTAASTLVGQAIGGGEEAEATRYGWDTLRIALATQLLIAAGMVLFAPLIVIAFGAEEQALTVDFIRLFGLVVGGFSVARTMQGALRGAGDTTWPLYGMLGGIAVRLGVATLALPAGFTVGLLGLSAAPGMGLGVTAVFAAILADFYVQAGVNTARFATGRWKEVARRAATGGEADSAD